MFAYLRDAYLFLIVESPRTSAVFCFSHTFIWSAVCLVTNC